MGEVSKEKNFNKSKGERVKLLCPKCTGKTNHEILQSVETSGDETDIEAGWHVNWADSYHIVECLGCDTVSFTHESYFSEYADPFPGGSDGTSMIVYPFRSEHSRAMKNYRNISPELRGIYREVVDTFNNGSFILCATGLRAVVEGICADKGIKSGPVEVPAKGGGTQIKNLKNIEGKISGIARAGYLSREHADTLHQLRFLGNDAVHELSEPRRQDLTIAIDLVESTLDSVYEVPRRGANLKKRRNKKP